MTFVRRPNAFGCENISYWKFAFAKYATSCSDFKISFVDNYSQRLFSRWTIATFDERTIQPHFKLWPCLSLHYKALKTSNIYTVEYSANLLCLVFATRRIIFLFNVHMKVYACASALVSGCFFSTSNINFDSLQKTKITNQICTSETFENFASACGAFPCALSCVRYVCYMCRNHFRLCWVQAFWTSVSVCM